jgi:hypothetical protein
MAERFPGKDLHRVVNAVSRLCKKAALLDLSQTSSELPGQTQKKSHGVRM